MGNLHVESEAGGRGEGPLAGATGQLTLPLVDTAVVVELRGNTEGLATVVAAVASRLRMDAAVILQGEQVGVGLEAHGAVVDADGVGVLVVEEGASVAVGAAALVTSVQVANKGNNQRKNKGTRREKGSLVWKEELPDHSQMNYWLPVTAKKLLICKGVTLTGI